MTSYASLGTTPTPIYKAQNWQSSTKKIQLWSTTIETQQYPSPPSLRNPTHPWNIVQYLGIGATQYFSWPEESNYLLM